VAKLNDKVQNALQEGRILVLGAQVLIGFGFRSVFEKGFEQLPEVTRYLKVAGLGVLLLALALLLWNAAYHRIVERGEDSHQLHRFVSRVMDWALLPFAIGLGIDLYVATEKVAGQRAGIAGGVLGLSVALFFWYGFEFWRRQGREPRIREEKEMSEEKDGGETGEEKTTNKIKHVLLESRMVLPGAQALLGFQFVTILTEGFDRLPDSSKAVHLASLALVALAIIFLITPAAYHRIVEEGEETEHFHRVASRLIVAAMIPLALGICGDFYVVVRKVTESVSVSIVVAGLMLAVIYGLWFGTTLYWRSRRRAVAA
jgi:DMSO reductase anchor subunit